MCITNNISSLACFEYAVIFTNFFLHREPSRFAVIREQVNHVCLQLDYIRTRFKPFVGFNPVAYLAAYLPSVYIKALETSLIDRLLILDLLFDSFNFHNLFSLHRGLSCFAVIREQVLLVNTIFYKSNFY
jgi:hypothetical protein